jgi:hypothetical protein
MIPFAESCGFRQFVPFKLYPLCLTNFVIAASNSKLSLFCIYVGKGTAPENDLKELGLSSAVIKLLCATVPRGTCHTVLHDAFLTDVKCAEQLL